MSDRKVIIDIETRNKGQGAGAAKKDLDDLDKKGGSVAEKLNKSAAAAEFFGKILRGLGAVAILTQIVEVAERLRAAINRSKAEAEQLGIKMKDAADEKAMAETVKQYDGLKTKIAEVNQQLERQIQLEALAKGGERGLEDANLSMSEVSEITALSPSDPERSQKEAAIRARYSRRREMTAASRRREDAILQRQQLEIEAASKETGAAGFEASAGELKRLAAASRSKGEEYEYRSRASRQYNWIKRMDEETPIGSDYRRSSEKALAEAEKLTKLASEAFEQAKAMRGEAAFSRARATAAGATVAAAEIDLRRADKAGTSTAGLADRALSEARSERESRLLDGIYRAEAKEGRLTELGDERTALMRERASIPGQIRSARAQAKTARSQAENFSTGMAWGANGRLVGKAEIEATAQETERGVERIVAALMARNKTLNSRLKEIEHKINREREAD